MQKSITIIAIFILVVTILSGCISNDKLPEDLMEPRENSEAGIKIQVTYLPDIIDATAFGIKVTAHSDYNDVFENISYLRDTSGKTYQPLSYEGSRGHHATGIIRFPRINGKSFELVIQNVAGVKERKFTW